MIDFSQIKLEEVMGGIVAILSAIYAIHKKTDSTTVENVSQKAEVNIIESLTKQRDDSIDMYEKYREKFVLCEAELQKTKRLLAELEIEALDHLESIDTLKSEVELLKSMIKYMNESIELINNGIISNNDRNNNI